MYELDLERVYMRWSWIACGLDGADSCVDEMQLDCVFMVEDYLLLLEVEDPHKWGASKKPQIF